MPAVSHIVEVLKIYFDRCGSDISRGELSECVQSIPRYSQRPFAEDELERIIITGRHTIIYILWVIGTLDVGCVRVDYRVPVHINNSDRRIDFGAIVRYSMS